ncbi:hypothetical protein QE370_000639 [Aeromicrobium sp. SORGH_AS981]|nr:hypothetical protein [Aeromicrobium sp. SORGH_AS_0981]
MEPSHRGVAAAERDHPATDQRDSISSVRLEWSRYARSTLVPRGSALLDQRNRWSSSSRARGTSVAAAYRDHPATAQRGPTPSERPHWSRYVSACSFVAASTTRPAERSTGRVAGTSLRGPCVSRPPGNGSARLNLQRPLGVVSIRPKHARASRLRATRPAERSAGRVAGTSLRGPCVSRPPGNGSARLNLQRPLGVVSIRPKHARASRLRATRPAKPSARRRGQVASSTQPWVRVCSSSQTVR